MKRLRTIREMRGQADAWRGEGLRIGLVPTMGGLHEGHLALIRAARAACDRVVASVFVNPTQFGPGEDFGVYPRDETGDGGKLEELDVDAMFAPAVDEMYPPGFSTTVQVGRLTESLCGAFRPHHFAGVTTVVTKLLIQVWPDVAFFGEKDYQQLQVIRRMVRDLDLPVRVEAVPTVREADGLALSSRNAYLSTAERRIAPELYRTLQSLARRVGNAAGAFGDIAAACGDARRRLEEAGFTRVDYVEVRDAETLEPVSDHRRPARALAAAWLGETRLIDNVPVPPAG